MNAIDILDIQHQLRDATAAAITTTTAGAVLAIDLTALDNYKIVVVVSALDTADADETYVISAEVDTTVAFATEIEVGSVTVTATGKFEIPLSRAFVEHLEAGAAFIRVVATLAGTTPSLTYGAFLVPTV